MISTILQISSITAFSKVLKIVLIFNYFLIQEAWKWSKTHPKVCGFYNTKSQAETSYGELNQAKLDFGQVRMIWPNHPEKW